MFGRDHYLVFQEFQLSTRGIEKSLQIARALWKVQFKEFSNIKSTLTPNCSSFHMITRLFPCSQPIKMELCFRIIAKSPVNDVNAKTLCTRTLSLGTVFPRPAALCEQVKTSNFVEQC